MVSGYQVGPGMASPEEIARRAASDTWLAPYDDSFGGPPTTFAAPSATFSAPAPAWTTPTRPRRKTGVKLVGIVACFILAVGVVNIVWDWITPERLAVPGVENVQLAANGLPEGYEWAGDLQAGGDKLICGPVTWELTGDTPSGGRTAVEEAVELAGAMTGVTIKPVEDVKVPAVEITFEYVSSRELRDASDGATPDTVGMAMTYHTSFGITSSEILLDEPFFEDTLSSDRDEAVLVIVHEIGHAFGLGHSDLKDSVMYPTLSDSTRVFPEDVAAFSAVAPDC
jgi:hypothetical protein